MRLIRWPLQALATTVITVVLLELVLQLAAWWLQPASRAAATTQANAPKQILTLGDSNTYGVFVAPEQTWPAQLQTLLAPTVNVVNLGWPGTNSSILNWQFSEALAQVKPDLVLVMIGVNDSWNRPIYRENIGLLQKIKLYSRSYRLLQLSLQHGKLLLNDNAPAPSTEVPADISAAEFAELITVHKPLETASSQLRHVPTGAGSLMLGVNTVPNNKRVDLKAMGFSSPVHYSAAGMQAQAKAAGIPLVFISYGADTSLYQHANSALQNATSATGLPLIDVRLHQLIGNDCLGYESGAHCKEWFYPDNHPTAEGYRLIAAKVAEFINNNALLTALDASAHQRDAAEH